MERNDDEFPPGDVPGGGEYPPAPLPPHERAWRHPSEVGASHWTSTEPPLALGRGLMVATGTIGMVLTGALVWAMLPGAGAPVTATSSVLAVADPATTLAPATSTVPPSTEETAPATAAPTTTTADPAPVVPVVALANDPAALATSVVVGEQVFLITTSAAVGDQQEVMVIGNDGGATEAMVVWSDPGSGLAVLAAPTADIDGSLLTADLPGPGSGVAIGSAEGMLGASIGIDPTGAMVLDGVVLAEVPEGSPVVDPAGRLVGLCTGSKVVPVRLPDAVLERLAELRGWLGVRLTGSPDAAPVILGLEPGSPADLAGLLDGDEVLRVDGREITSVAELQWMVARHLPGDTVVIDVMRAGEPLDGIEVVLAERPTSL